MLRAMILSMLGLSLVLAVSAHASPDGTIIEGDLRITGTAGANGLVFPDGSTQYTAASGGPVFVSAPLSGAGTSASPIGISVGSGAGTVAAGNDPRLSDARPPLAGSPNYIQNGSVPQVGSFNVTGDGTIGGNLNLGGQVSPLRIQNSTLPPGAASASNAGQVYFDTTTGTLMMSNGTAWINLGPRKISYTTGSLEVALNDGFVSGRDLIFTKYWSGSRLRITYSDNLRVLGPSMAGQWEIYLDGSPLPQPIKTSLYVDAGDTHRQSTLVGYASGIATGANHLQVKVSPVPGLSGTANFDTGWQSTYLLEVEEIP